MHDLSAALRALAPRLVPGARTVDGLVRLSGGASQETWAFQSGGVDLILRRAPSGGQRSGEAIGMAAEAALIAAAGAAGAPVPRVVHVCAPEDGLGEAFVMARVAGETIARKILRDAAFAHARTVLAEQCGRALASIHAVPADRIPAALATSDGLDQLARYEAICHGMGAERPVMELAFQWLRATAPAPRPPTLVHGDFRNGNLMVDETGLAAVLDWELAHVGDPREDLGWICVNSWRFGVREKRVGGFGDLDALLSGYAAGGATPPSPADVRWFEALGTLKWGVMCLIMHQAFASGADPSVERAMIGRRASETEIDLIAILEAAAKDA
jgi:aminoglycoside phosphotransferase (APT) family kinase protein